MHDNDGFQRNLAAIAGRVAFLRDLPDGTIHERPDSMHNLLIRKIGTRLELVFLGGQSREVISDFDYANPLDLYADFTQVMTLGLLWKPEPSRVYVLGFGAGRVPMVLHHHFPKVRIESTDIDGDVVAAAHEFCGILPDERQQIFVEDGRRYLAGRGPDVQYDIIMVDAFRGVGYSPPLLATLEFYQTCKGHLVSNGVVVVNLMGYDYLIKEKIKALKVCFNAVFCIPLPSDGTVVMFASDNDSLGRSELFERARVIAKQHEFVFPFVEHAIHLQEVSQMPELAAALVGVEPLSDSAASQPPPPNPTASGSSTPPQASGTAGNR